jgi:PAS domain-containing protein
VTDSVEDVIGQIAHAVAPMMSPFVAGPILISGEATRKLYDEPALIDQAVIDHPRYLEAVEAVGKDKALRRIAPRGSRGPTFAAGDSWRGLSADTLVPSLIAAAAFELRALGVKPSPKELSAAAVLNVHLCRELAHGERPSVLTVMGFSGIEIATGAALELPWGEFRSRNGWYGIAEVLPFRPTTCVLLARHPLPFEMNAVPPRESKAHSDHAEWTDLVSRQLMLSVVCSTQDAPTAPLPTFRLTVLPFEVPTSAGGPMILAPPLTPRELDEAELLEVKRWAEIIQLRYSHPLEVAAKRLIAALAHRIDPADRLIDAVTAWEALFGGSHEASLRVSGSIAWLLEPNDPVARQRLQEEAKGIYDLRSRVVHGDDPELQKVHAASYRATDIAVTAVSRIVEGRPELIPLNSASRSARLLFEGSVKLTPP